MASRDRVRPGHATSVASLLLVWYRQGHRDLPWRRTNDPYRIWVSEIMLQQTRAQAVIPYYERFLERFPSANRLAQTSEEEVLAVWSGLGYYSRARNLRRAAQQIQAAGGFPREYDVIKQLPGVGDYTAAAIASIAFGLPHAVADGNVFRVVARVENDASDITVPRTRERFRGVAQNWLDPHDPGAFNQALMELGATLCLTKNPLCLVCPLTELCRARAEGTAEQLPVKLRRVEPVRIESIVLVVLRRGRVLLRQRPASERRMAGFWELPSPGDLPGLRVGETLGTFRHTITHHHYTFEVATATAKKAGSPYRWFPPAQMPGIPLSTTARKALEVAGLLERSGPAAKAAPAAGAVNAADAACPEGGL
jgi:A/G-specific adenine glycosylase